MTAERSGGASEARKCSVEACGGRHTARGLCRKHYRQMWTKGNLPDVSLRATLEQRFWEKVQKSDTCWLWMGTRKTSGYGAILIDYREVYAHRVSVWLSGRETPKGMHVDHLCRNHQCVRPDHLEVVTPKENIRRGLAGHATAARMASRTHCINGHEFSGENLVISCKGWRLCRTCSRERDARARQKKSTSERRGPRGRRGPRLSAVLQDIGRDLELPAALHMKDLRHGFGSVEAEDPGKQASLVEVELVVVVRPRHRVDGVPVSV